MDEDAIRAATAWEKVVSVLGKPGHCKHVDHAVQTAVRDALRRQGVDAPGLGSYLGNQAQGFCTTQITPEGRTLAIIAAGAAATVYTVLNYEEVEGAILDAVKKARVPVRIPIPEHYGTLTAKIGFDAARAEWDLKAANGMRLNSYFEQRYNGDSPTFGVGASQQLSNGNMNFSAGVNAEGQASVMFKLQLKF